MSKWEHWLLPGILAAVGVPFLIAGGVIRVILPRTIATHAQEVARLRVATADTLNERGARVLLEGWVSDRTAPSDRPPLVAYNEYQRVRRDGEWEWDNVRSYAPTLWVQIPGGEVEIMAEYTLRSTASKVEDGRDRVYEGFQVEDPILVLGTLTVVGDSRSVREPTWNEYPSRNQPVVGEAEIGYETKADYLVTLKREQFTARWLGLLFLVLGSLLTLSAVVTAYLIWHGRLNLFADS
ncbi:hypothetical protein IQ265_00255 [Nodosilinea sp. LEGE 06152]|uniref:hypothetical protein n=1 Tax=Nodosilinea sp. LEGE 06152 TaxID=2777966 RepID=UPI0018824C57|nr:hypothetical protein [Nodosilinea sp. LEGE 06152]MBE9155280.1 hypothetical protein [Nodosilinea sp. LEGE 06152]